MSEQLRAAAEAVLDARGRKLLADDAVAELKAEHAAIFNRQTEARDALVQAEYEARNARLDHYFATGELGTISGLAVQRVDVPEYEDIDALVWVVQHQDDEQVLAWFLAALDKHRPALNALIKARAPRFVRIVRKPRATIATDLGAKLSGDDMAAAIEAERQSA